MPVTNANVTYNPLTLASSANAISTQPGNSIMAPPMQSSAPSNATPHSSTVLYNPMSSPQTIVNANTFNTDAFGSNPALVGSPAGGVAIMMKPMGQVNSNQGVANANKKNQQDKYNIGNIGLESIKINGVQFKQLRNPMKSHDNSRDNSKEKEVLIKESTPPHHRYNTGNTSSTSSIANSNAINANHTGSPPPLPPLPTSPQVGIHQPGLATTTTTTTTTTTIVKSNDIINKTPVTVATSNNSTNNSSINNASGNIMTTTTNPSGVSSPNVITNKLFSSKKQSVDSLTHLEDGPKQVLTSGALRSSEKDYNSNINSNGALVLHATSSFGNGNNGNANNCDGFNQMTRDSYCSVAGSNAGGGGGNGNNCGGGSGNGNGGGNGGGGGAGGPSDNEEAALCESPRRTNRSNSSGSHFKEKKTSVGYRLGKRKLLFEKRRQISDYALIFAMTGVLLMIIETEFSMSKLYSKVSDQ